MGSSQQDRWNHNIHYHRLVLEAIPNHARTALDVGTGNGLLAADLRRVVPDVTAIDIDETVLATARAESDDVAWILGDALTHDFGRTFDVVASVAAIHHLPDLACGLRRLRELTASGGVLVVVGLARPTRPLDFARNAIGLVQHRWHALRKGYWHHTAPIVWPPPHSYSEVRRCAAEELPGVEWRQLPMFRYALTWQRPRTRVNDREPR